MLTNFAITPVDTQISDLPILETSPMIRIYPNPTQGKVIVESSNKSIEQATFSLMDLYGKSLAVKGIPEGHNRIRLELSGLEIGWYFLRISLSDNSPGFIPKIWLQKE